MADISCSIPVSKKHSDATGVRSKHIYDGVFSAPAPRKLNGFRIDDYSEIFSPSKASLGLSIPTLDLPAVDQSDLTGGCWSSSVDYAGVFGGLGDDNGFEISADELFLKSKRKKSKRNSRRSRSSKQTKIKTQIDQEFSCVYGNNQATTSPTHTKISPSKSQELCSSSRNDQASTSVLSNQPCDRVKDFNDSHHKTNESSKDGTDGTTSNACIHTAPLNTHMFDEVGPSRETGLGKAKFMGMVDADFKDTREVSDLGLDKQANDSACIHTAPLNTHMFDEVGPSRETGLGKAKFMGMDDADFKDTREVSDLGLDKQANDREAGLTKEFEEDICYTFVASHSTGEADCESQTYSEPALSSSPRLFSTNDNFRRSSSIGSKNSTNNQQSSEAADSSSLLNQDLDENSAAAVSAAAMKRAIEEAEAEIRSAKEFLKGKEINGAGRLSFKDIFNVKATSDTIHSYGACELKQNGSPKVDATVQNQYVDEDNLLQQEDDLNSKATRENNDFNEAFGLKSLDNLNVTAEIEDHFGEMQDSSLQPEFVNGAELEDMPRSVEVLKSAEKSHEGGGEWEPAKQFSQLLTGVKNRFVSFISKQADTEKTVIQGTERSNSESVAQSERSAYQVHYVDAHVREADQDHLEKEVERNGYASSVSEERAQDSNRVGIEMCKPEENDVIVSVALERGKVEEVTVSSDVKMPITEQYDPSELDKVEVQESVEVKHTLMQEDIQDQDQAIVDESMKREDDEKSQMENNELEQHDITLEASYKRRNYGSKERECEDNQDADEKGVYESLDGEDGNWRQEEGFISVEDTITEELEESVLATELCTMEYSETSEFLDDKGEATVGLIEIADDTSEHDDVCEHDESLLLSKNEEACVHVERSKYAQLVEEEVAGRMENLATSPIASKVSDEQLIIELRVNDEQLIIEPNVNDEQPIIEPEGSDEQLIIEPKVNDEQPITEPKGNDDQPIIEPEVNDEQPSFESKVNDENPNIEPKVNIEQAICFETANQLDKEDITEQPRHSLEAVADISPEHDNYFPAADICERGEKSSLNKIEEASGCDDSIQYAHDVDVTFEKEGMGESTNTTSETKGNLEQLSFVHTANELLGKAICEPAECSTELANETVDHDECPPSADDACMTEEHSYLNGKDEDERVTESPVVTSEPELNVEQPSYVQISPSLIGEDMTETSTAAGNPEDIDVIEEEIEDTHEVLSHTNILKVQQETDLNCEQKHLDEETLTTDIGLENQVDESVCSTDTEEVDMASDQDKTMYDFETSYKRKRWFEKDEMQDLHQTDILLGDEINQEPYQENVEGFIVDDRVESDVDETVIESCSGLEDGHSTEPTHRRRRWFQYRGDEAMHKPTVIDVAEMTTEMDDGIVQESELDDSFRDSVDNLMGKKKETTDVQDKDVSSDQLESTANDGEAPRRRKWFENGEKSGPAQRPSILVDNVIDTDPGEIEIEADAAIHDDKLNDREAQKEKERIVVERAIREARKRAFTEVRKKAAAAAQDKQGKASSEPKTGSDRASMDAKLRVERAAVERATAEARERALQKAVSAKAASESREKDPKNQTSGPSCSKGCTSGPFASEISSGATSESPQRRKAVSERNRRTMERAAKALEEKNMRDSFAQKEQAERDRFADALDGEVKRWLIGKDGNLRSLLSTLQYILGPDSGWQPIPLLDLIDPTAVRKAYKRAALCVHPDKLQQRGATVQQKYICEKVFDLLKDAWQWHEICPDDL